MHQEEKLHYRPSLRSYPCENELQPTNYQLNWRFTIFHFSMSSFLLLLFEEARGKVQFKHFKKILLKYGCPSCFYVLWHQLINSTSRKLSNRQVIKIFKPFSLDDIIQKLNGITPQITKKKRSMTL